MAEPESILQLGIEAAREGKKEEARQFFRLLTQQEPDNAQGWLWLAGVAENREERQDALERVLMLDPTNEMALKGLQALGVSGRPMAPPPERAATPVRITPEETFQPTPQAEPEQDLYSEADSFAELNELSETMATDASGPVRRIEPEPVAREAGVPPPRGAAPWNEPTPRRTESQPPAGRRVAVAPPTQEPQGSPSRPFSPLVGWLLFLVGVGLIGLLIAFLMPGLFGGEETAQVEPPERTAAAQTSVVQTAEASGLISDGTTTANPALPISTMTPGDIPTATIVQPTTTPEPTPTADLAAAAPAIVNANTPLQSEGWIYDFNQPTFAASIVGTLGQYTPNNGRFVIVLVFAINGTGVEQTIPGNFFVLKDAQGRVWEARPEVSAAYVVPGVNADLTHTQPLLPDGITRSVALIFDVAPDATDLVFFARSNPSQGWLVLRSV